LWLIWTWISVKGCATGSWVLLQPNMCWWWLVSAVCSKIFYSVFYFVFVIYAILIFVNWIWLCSVKKYDVSRHDLCVDFTKWNDVFKGVSIVSPIVSGFMTVLVFKVFNLQNQWDCCVWGMVNSGNWNSSE
jgi:hypothetical protein